MPKETHNDTEQEVALLIADLSGYTALTETHGPRVAADVIHTYVEMVRESMAGHCELYQRVGDEIVIMSSSASCILSTSISLLQKCAAKEGFLQVHGGLHWGPVLKRNGDLFGTTINLTSRIAASAPSGSFYCSGEFLEALDTLNRSEFPSRGKFTFKNLPEGKELFEMNADCARHFQIDPICRMLVSTSNNPIMHPEKEIYFCSETCRDLYLARTP